MHYFNICRINLLLIYNPHFIVYTYKIKLISKHLKIKTIFLEL